MEKVGGVGRRPTSIATASGDRARNSSVISRDSNRLQSHASVFSRNVSKLLSSFSPPKSMPGGTALSSLPQLHCPVSYR